jgi:Na+-translocating ferredoxin:NAD+ oxidoreductase RnfD subunit/predicted flap endonuclease-1-like 5' DNA nuclease/NAD-dependent dihydropyrimidine dehydrogenase PreA subunit
MSKPKEYSPMTKDKLMTYTFIALVVLTALSVLSFGYNSLIVALISVGVAVAIDLLLAKVAEDSPLNLLSAAVFGLIVALSYTLGLPTQGANATYDTNITMQGAGLYIFPALISMVGMVLFKKIQGLRGRKLVNPAAAAKLIVLIFLISVALMPAEHPGNSLSMIPSLTTSLSLNSGTPMPFGLGLQLCFAQDYSAYLPDYSAIKTIGLNDVLYTMTVMKYHGWVGGISSIAVIAVGLALFALCRRYIKWRITAAYLASVALFALALSFVYADGDPILRVVFHLFIGSSIFLAFFMATDPATTPLTYTGQLIFGVGLGLLTVLIQTYLNFFGGSILALVLMNLTSPFLDRVGKLRPMTETKEPKLPKAKQFTKVKTYACIRCGACLRVCCHKLSPILIKEAFDKQNVEKLVKLNADYCTGCGHCSYICPARLDLKGSTLRAKAMLRTEQTPEPETKSAVIETPKAEPSHLTEEIKTKPVKETMDRGSKISDIEGIGPVHAAKLNSINIYTTSELLEAGATPLGRKELAEKTGISDKLILEWVNMADLFRIKGVGEEYSDLLAESGVDTVVELAKRVPENLHAKMLEVNKEKNLVRRLPTLSEVKQWVEEAKKLPRKIQY